VTDATAPPSKKSSLGRRIRDAVAEYPAATAIGLYALVAMAATVAAYLSIFTVFAPYDDEGTLLVTVKAFVHGDILYRDIYSAYGPFYYEVFGGLFALTGHAVTTDASRSIVIVVWVGTSLLFGLAAQRLTGRLMLGVTGMIAAFAALGVLVGEPMHPQGLCVLLLGAFVLLAVCGPTRRVAWAGAACGALLAALVLTKANLGVFAIAAVVLAAVWSVGPLYRRPWVRWPVVAAFLAMPLLITARDLGTGWIRELMVLEVFAMVALLGAAWPLRAKRGEDDAGLMRWLLAGAAGFVVALAAILVAIFLTGPSPADVYDGIVTQAFRIRDVLVSQFPFPPVALDWGVAAVAAAFLTTRLRSGSGDKPAIWPGLLRAVAGLTILFTVAHIVPFGLNPSAANPDTLPMLLAWVAAVPVTGVRESTYKRFLRVLLPALAVAETLQVYPVAGSQMGIASLTFVPVGALCLADAMTDLRAWAAVRGAPSLERLGAVLGVVMVAVAGIFALDSIVRPATTNAVLYRDEPKLPFAGAGLMHLPAPTVETYAGVVDLLHRYRCSTFIGYPSIDSLYLWSGLDAPAPQIPNAWMKALDKAQQQHVVNELRAAPRPCAIRSNELAELYLHGSPPPNLPLVHYVLNGFRPVARAGNFEFLLPKRPAPAP
jgi:hypothetical protein